MRKKVFFLILFFLIPTTRVFAVGSSDLIIKNSNTVVGGDSVSTQPKTIPGTEALINTNANQSAPTINNYGTYFSLSPANSAASMVTGANDNISAIIAATTQNSQASNLIIASQSAEVASRISNDLAARVMAAEAAGTRTETVNGKVINKANGNEVVGTPKSLTIIKSDGSQLKIEPTADQIQRANIMAKATGSNQEYVRTEQVITYDQRPTVYKNDIASICTPTGCTYTLMAPIGDLLGKDGVYKINKNDKNGLCSLLNSWFRIGIALAGMLAVVMIVLGGFQYATTDSLFGKEDGKGKIQNALWGLMLALTTWVIINTINPALTKCEINAVEVQLSALVVAPTTISNSGTFGGGVLGLGMTMANMATGNSIADYSFLNSFSPGNDVHFTAYGYKGDLTPDKNSSERRGNKNNLLVSGSVALSPELISRLNPKPGAAVYVDSTLVGYYDDSTAKGLSGNRVDFFDPTGSLGGNNFSKKVSGTISVDNNNVRAQTRNPSR